jgi:NAD+ kinase
MSSLNLGIYAHWRKPGAKSSLESLIGALRAEGLRITLEENTARLIRESGVTLFELQAQADLLIALGGDGTLLRLVRDLHGKVRPIMGINFGSLGFLTCFGGPNYAEAASALARGSYRIDERTLLRARIEREGTIRLSQLGLNDVVVSRGERSRLVRAEVWIDDHCLTSYNADGLIVATATGSTAYSLSAGGPIVSPESGVFIVTPICPHVLTNRSVIVSDQSTIRLRPCPGSQPLLVSVDGQEPIQLVAEDVVIVDQADSKVPLLLPHDLSFADILRTKLRWSGSAI